MSKENKMFFFTKGNMMRMQLLKLNYGLRVISIQYNDAVNDECREFRVLMHNAVIRDRIASFPNSKSHLVVAIYNL